MKLKPNSLYDLTDCNCDCESCEKDATVLSTYAGYSGTWCEDCWHRLCEEE